MDNWREACLEVLRCLQKLLSTNHGPRASPLAWWLQQLIKGGIQIDFAVWRIRVANWKSGTAENGGQTMPTRCQRHTRW
jgi:hypothetical protein